MPIAHPQFKIADANVADWRWWTLVAVPGFLGLTLLLEAPHAFAELLGDGGGALTQSFITYASCWLIWLSLAPGLFWLLCRTPIEAPQVWTRLMLHVGAAFVFVLVHLALHAALSAEAWTADGRSFSERYRAYLGAWLALELVIFVMIDGIFHAVRFAVRERAAAERERELEHAKTAAQLESLRRQLEPHFLFNALNSLCATLPADSVGRRMAVLLADYLRLTLERASVEKAPLREELALLRAYLDVEQLRHGERLETTFAIAAAAMNAQAPVLVLQPLAENAVRHATAGSDRKGQIIVSADVRAEELVLTIMNEPADAGAEHGSGGRGHAIVRERLLAAYGGRAQFAVGRPAPDQYCAEIVLPLERAP